MVYCETRFRFIKLNSWCLSQLADECHALTMPTTWAAAVMGQRRWTFSPECAERNIFLSNLNLVDSVFRLRYRSFCGRSDTLNTNYDRFPIESRETERKRSAGKGEWNPKLFLLFIIIFVFLSDFRFSFIWFFSVVLCSLFVCGLWVDVLSLRLLMPFSHSAYIEFRLKEFDPKFSFYLCFDGCALAITSGKDVEIRRKIVYEPNKY